MLVLQAYFSYNTKQCDWYNFNIILRMQNACSGQGEVLGMEGLWEY